MWKVGAVVKVTAMCHHCLAKALREVANEIERGVPNEFSGDWDGGYSQFDFDVVELKEGQDVFNLKG